MITVRPWLPPSRCQCQSHYPQNCYAFQLERCRAPDPGPVIKYCWDILQYFNIYSDSFGCASSYMCHNCSLLLRDGQITYIISRPNPINVKVENNETHIFKGDLKGHLMIMPMFVSCSTDNKRIQLICFESTE